MTDPLSEHEKAVGMHLADQMLDGGESPPLKLAVRTSAVALDRWGRDLERDAPDQEWSAFEPVVEQTAADVLACFDDGGAQVVDVDGYVFGGYVVDETDLVTQALGVTELIEDNSDFDRHEPGALVEPVEEGSA